MFAENEAVGLDYFGARYFSGARARFTPSDLSNVRQPAGRFSWESRAERYRDC
jgi:hypothetical protein